MSKVRLFERKARVRMIVALQVVGMKNGTECFWKQRTTLHQNLKSFDHWDKPYAVTNIFLPADGESQFLVDGHRVW